MKLLDILLVDDDRDDCGMFGIAVDKTGLNICLQTVRDGDQAIDYLQGRGVYADRSRHPVPELVVLDLDVRLTSGLDFLGWCRGSLSFSWLPVVALLSSFAYKGVIETAMAMGAKASIAKPFEVEDWESVVRQIWDMGMERKESMKPAFEVGR